MPEFVLVGGSGLVRAILLSNRVHALTVDTAGVVAVWDIVRAVCVGQFAREDVLHAVNVHNNTGGGGSTSHPQGGEKVYACSPREALDLVRERIDGEAFVMPWSFVDTSMGVLNVHLDEHAFDAELYADELGLPPDRTLPASISSEDVRGVYFFQFEIFISGIDGYHVFGQLTWENGYYETFSWDSSVRRKRHIRSVCVPLQCRPRGVLATMPLPRRHRHHV